MPPFFEFLVSVKIIIISVGCIYFEKVLNDFVTK